MQTNVSPFANSLVLVLLGHHLLPPVSLLMLLALQQYIGNTGIPIDMKFIAY